MVDFQETGDFMKQVFSRLMDWQRFYTLMKRGLKVFLFYLTVLSLFRFVFILWMHDYMSDAVGASDVLMALWRGLRIRWIRVIL